MVHLILASHGDLSESMKKTAEMIMGPQENILTITLEPHEDQEDFKKKFEAARENLDDYVVFTDLSGGTPNNVISKFLIEGESFPVYAGMNLPMVIGFLNTQMIGEEDADYTKRGIENIVNINELLK